jgi:hypothetical protein
MLSCDVNPHEFWSIGRPIPLGVTFLGEATREAPVWAEPHPACAAASLGNLPYKFKLALMLEVVGTTGAL